MTIDFYSKHNGPSGLTPKGPYIHASSSQLLVGFACRSLTGSHRRTLPCAKQEVPRSDHMVTSYAGVSSENMISSADPVTRNGSLSGRLGLWPGA